MSEREQELDKSASCRNVFQALCGIAKSNETHLRSSSCIMIYTACDVRYFKPSC